MLFIKTQYYFTVLYCCALKNKYRYFNFYSFPKDEVKNIREYCEEGGSFLFRPKKNPKPYNFLGPETDRENA